MKYSFIVLSFILFLFSGLNCNNFPESGQISKIVIVSDDNYPPYIFRDSEGKLQGVIVEQWQLWESITGVEVDLQAMDWDKAKQKMAAKESDVIETIFYTPERAKIYDFTKPYAELPVPVFYNKKLSGITKLSDLKGFTVGVKSGDACIDELKEAGVYSLQEYPSYEEIIKAASNKTLHVFCIDEPPAMYFLFKYGLEDDFNYAFNVYTGQFHRAVQKGNTQLLSLIENGFAKIPSAELDKINRKWMGKKLQSIDLKKIIIIIIIITLIVGLLFLNLLIMNRVLLKRVKERTKELTKTLRELRESESRNNAFLNGNPDLMFLFSENGDIIDFKTIDTDLLFAKPEEFINRNVYDVMPKNIADLTLEKITKIAVTGEIQYFEYNLDFKGKIEYYEARLVNCGEHEFLAIIRCITEKKEIENERMRSNKLESLGILAGGIAHDFNNILTSILGNLSLIKFQDDLSNDIRILVSEAEKACLRAKNLTVQLLTFSKGGSPIKENADLNEIIKESADFVLRGSSSRCVYLLDPNLYCSNVDKGQVSQVIQNLVINAIQAMPTGGTIKIKSENCNQVSGNLQKLEPGQYVKISIIDEGMGIQEKDLPMIFDPYFSTKIQGSGLGLTICYSIIHHHQGSIDVSSSIGKGSTFEIYLPGSDCLLPKVKMPVQNIQNEKMKCRILIMDDDEQICMVGKHMLTYLGYNADTASHGEEVLHKIQENYDSGTPYDLLILDLTIQGKMGGKETMSIIKQKYPHLKAIVTSGYSNDPVMSNYNDYGFSGYLLKPFDLVTIKKTIEDVLS